MKWSLGKGADFASVDEVDKYREYLECETSMPMDMIDFYVADFINQCKLLANFNSWKKREDKGLAARKKKSLYLSDADEDLIKKYLGHH